MSTLHLGTNADPTKNITITPDGTGNLVVRDGNGAALATIEPGDFTAGTNRLSEKLTQGTPITLTNQTFVDFAIPSWAKRITVMFNGVSTNGSSPVQVQLGHFGGIETTGYSAASTILTAANIVSTSVVTSGFAEASGGAVILRHGAVDINLLNVSSNTWAYRANIGSTDTQRAFLVYGSKTLSDTLTTVRITTVNGTDQFDSGTINVMWE